MAWTTVLMASSCPKTTDFRLGSSSSSLARSLFVRFLVGILAMRETTFSMCFTVMVAGEASSGRLSLIKAAASSMISIALSGRNLSPIYLADSSAAAFRALLVYFTL